MWEAVFSLASSVLSSKYAKAVLIALACALSAWVAYSHQAHRYEAQIADIKAQIATQVAQQEKENAQKLSKAIEERDTANARLDSLNRSNATLLDKLRKSDRDSDADKTADSANAVSEKYSRCRKFLLEGAELLSEACERFGKCATDKDALIEIVK